MMAMKGFYYVYILKSLKDGKNYTGYTGDLPSRLEAHQKGEVNSTKHRRPLDLIYFEGCLSQKDALKREKQLKNWNRQWKIDLIEKENKEWKDLSIDWKY